MKIALLQTNPIVGDLDRNADKIKNSAENASKLKPDLIVTSELALLGYPPRDLLLYPDFIVKAWKCLDKLAKETRNLPPILVGTSVMNKNKIGRPLFNTAAFLKGGRIEKLFFKSLLPTHDVFDEDRYFEPINKPQILKIDHHKIGISICEDLWNDKDYWQKPRYHFDPIENLTKERVDLIINLSASPFTIGKQKLREEMIASSAKKYKIPIVYVNQVGGNDDLIFDGASMAFNSNGQCIGRAKAFTEDIIVIEVAKRSNVVNSYPKKEESLCKAIELGIHDYVIKSGFKKVIIGLSGGIDSALTATLAARALGPNNVIGVLMSSPYTSKNSVNGAEKLASNLQIETLSIGISEIMKSFSFSLEKAFKGYKKDVTEQNIQARIRGNLLMALSNKYMALVLATGNKSELTVGYTTLYGDMVGGLAPIGDLTKTQVYKLTRWINRIKEVIPPSILKKAPTAELKLNQKDQDDLPPYNILDKVLELHIEKQLGAKQINANGYKKDLVENILSMVKRAEFKRRQAPPALKVTGRAFGSGWRMPIAASGKIS